MLKNARFSTVTILFIVVIVTVSIVAGGLFLLNKYEENSTHKFLIPTGFTGWVEVTYEQPGSPALKKEGRNFIYEVPPTGKIKTSSKNVSGPMDFNYVDQDGQLIDFPTDVPMIHETHTSSGGGSGSQGAAEKLSFFVGTEEQWQEAKKNNPPHK